MLQNHLPSVRTHSPGIRLWVRLWPERRVRPALRLLLRSGVEKSSKVLVKRGHRGPDGLFAGFRSILPLFFRQHPALPTGLL